jgi:hypothetical protein
MMTAKCLRRQAATCASLAQQTDDDESRERYLRLQQLYLQLADNDDPCAADLTDPVAAAPIPPDEMPVHRAH